MPGVEKNHSTLIGVHGGDMYLTDMTFVADGDKARAFDVIESRRVYVYNSHFSMFLKDKDGVIRLEPGARATISDSEFRSNTVVTGKPDAIAAGPAMGLYAVHRGNVRPSAAWFDNCQFSDHISAVAGEVSIENRNCRVYSNTNRPTVWDLEIGREFRAWSLELYHGPSPSVNVFADVESVTDGRAFLRPTDPAFQSMVDDQVRNTGLPRPFLKDLPQGNEFVTQAPYAVPPRPNPIPLIVGLSVGAVLGVLCVLAVRCIYIRRKRAKKRLTAVKTLVTNGYMADAYNVLTC
eukprot:jgi/Ulvmu1/1983/UM012_0145.1